MTRRAQVGTFREVTPEHRTRYGGLALMAAFPLQVVGFALHPPTEELTHVLEPRYGAAHYLLFISWVLVMLDLPVLYAAQARRAGRLGAVAFVGAMLAVAYHLYLTLYEAAAVPLIATQPGTSALLGSEGPLGHGAGALGPIAGLLLLAFPLLGFVTLRARVLPASAGWLQAASLPAFLIVMLSIGAVTGGAVGPDATTWVAGMLPISTLYWLLFAGWAIAGAALRATPETEPLDTRTPVTS